VKKVLIITYYWPPSGGAGVQRWLKFSKYLPENGWKPIIYTPENPEYPAVDENLLSDVHPEVEVLKTRIWEPYSLYKKFTSRKKDSKIGTGFTSEKAKVSKAEKIARWVRGNWFIPDARKFWIKPSMKFLTEYLKTNSVDAIISTGPPHSMHLIALGLKKKFPEIKWVADFRDPWTNIDFIDELHLTASSENKHAVLEKSVLKECDEVLVIGNSMKEEFSETVNSDKIKVIPNGFDSVDYGTQIIPLDKKFTLAYIGSFSPSRNLPTLWKALGELVAEHTGFATHFQLKMAGQLDQSVRKNIDKEELTPFLNHVGYLNHKEVLTFSQSSQVLLLSVNRTKNAKGIITGKVFEYLNTGRPILTIGPEDGDLADLLKSVNVQSVIEYDDLNKIKQRILEDFEKYKDLKRVKDVYKSNKILSALPQEEQNLIKEIKEKKLTYLSVIKLSSILNTCKSLEADKVEGVFIEADDSTSHRRGYK